MWYSAQPSPSTLRYPAYRARSGRIREDPHRPDVNKESEALDELEPKKPFNTTSSASNSTVLPFEDLNAPEPSESTPPVVARWLGLLAVTVSGLLGGLIGYGTGDLMGGTQLWTLGGLVVGAATAAIGVGVIVSLTLRAMNEWEATSHPEAKPKKAKRKSTTAQGLRELAAEHDRKHTSSDNDTPTQSEDE